MLIPPGQLLQLSSADPISPEQWAEIAQQLLDVHTRVIISTTPLDIQIINLRPGFWWCGYCRRFTVEAHPYCEYCGAPRG